MDSAKNIKQCSVNRERRQQALSCLGPTGTMVPVAVGLALPHLEAPHQQFSVGAFFVRLCENKDAPCTDLSRDHLCHSLGLLQADSY